MYRLAVADRANRAYGQALREIDRHYGEAGKGAALFDDALRNVLIAFDGGQEASLGLPAVHNPDGPNRRYRLNVDAYRVIFEVMAGHDVLLILAVVRQ